MDNFILPIDSKREIIQSFGRFSGLFFWKKHCLHAETNNGELQALFWPNVTMFENKIRFKREKNGF